MENKEIAVLVLQLAQYQTNHLLQQDLCGRTITDWVKMAVAPFPHVFLTVAPQDDIMTLFKANRTDAKYTVITYEDMPLLSTEAIQQAVDYCEHKHCRALKLPRGWVFATAYVAENENFKIDNFPATEPTDYLVAFNAPQIAKIRGVLQARINEKLLKNGVKIIDPEHTYIDATVTVAVGCTIEPNVHLLGQTKIGANTKILQGSRLVDTTVGADCQIGPYAHLRPQSQVGDRCRLGNFVEVKRSQIGNDTKIAHMSYVGDATIGDRCNIGCGVIFCNYNGRTKSPTKVGNQVFIGSNTCLVAPLTIGNQAFIAAGSVITDQLPDRALGIARARQAIKENYVTE